MMLDTSLLNTQQYKVRIEAKEEKPWEKSCGGCPRGVIIKAFDCRILISEYELQLRYYVHFRTNTLRKGMNPLILLAIG